MGRRGVQQRLGEKESLAASPVIRAAGPSHTGVSCSPSCASKELVVDAGRTGGGPDGLGTSWADKDK